MSTTHPRLFRLLCLLLMLLALACAWLFPLPLRAHAAPVYFSALWDSSTSATIQWYQTVRGCLYVEHATGERVFIQCYGRYPATIRVELGHAGPLDGTARPAAGDVFILVTNGQTYRTPIAARRWQLYLPVVWR